MSKGDFRCENLLLNLCDSYLIFSALQTSSGISSLAITPSNLFSLSFNSARDFGGVVLLFSLSKSINSKSPLSSTVSPRADKTSLLNLYGLAVEAMIVFVLSPVSVTYCSYTSTATAV